LRDTVGVVVSMRMVVDWEAVLPALSAALAVTLLVPSAVIVQGLEPHERVRDANPLVLSEAEAERVTDERYQPLLPSAPVGERVMVGEIVSLRTTTSWLVALPALSVALAVIVVVPSAVMVQGLEPQERLTEATPLVASEADAET